MLFSRTLLNYCGVVGAVAGGAAWLPWFLLIVIPWAIAVGRRR